MKVESNIEEGEANRLRQEPAKLKTGGSIPPTLSFWDIIFEYVITLLLNRFYVIGN